MLDDGADADGDPDTRARQRSDRRVDSARSRPRPSRVVGTLGAERSGRSPRRARMACVLVVGVWTALSSMSGGCDSAPAPVDAGSDGAAVAAPALPAFIPCPTGWREVVDASGVSECDPWPASGRRSDCAADEAHFVGTPGCARVGPACAPDGWPTVPAGSTVIYVDDDAPAGGDGRSPASALPTLAAGLAAAPPGGVVALASGRYDVGPGVTIDGGRSVIGSCTAAAVLTSSAASDLDGVVTLGDAGRLVAVAVRDAERTGVVCTGAGAALEDVIIDRSATTSIFVGSGELTLHHVVASHGRPGLGGEGEGLYVDTGAHVIAEDLVVDAARGGGVIALEAGTRVELTRIAIVGTLADRAGELGHGLDVDYGASATVRVATVEGSTEIGVAAGGTGTTLDAADLRVRDTGPATLDGALGRGIDATAGVHVTLARVVVERGHDGGIVVNDAGTTVDATDLWVRDNVGEMDSGAGGSGVLSQEQASVTLSRVRIERCLDNGLFVTHSATLDATDVTIVDVDSERAEHLFGGGLWAQDYARASLTRARIERVRGTGAAAVNDGVVVLDDVSVDGVRAAACAELGTCADLGAGFGLIALFGGSMRVTSFDVRDSVTCGVVVGEDGSAAATAMDLMLGTIASTPVGACVQVPDYDAERLHQGVRYVDVGVPLSATSYSLPMHP